jgi:hypothetical protein
MQGEEMIHSEEFKHMNDVGLFYQRVKEDLGIVDNPKADLLMNTAWDLGHSAGFMEVYIYACDLVDLIR